MKDYSQLVLRLRKPRSSLPFGDTRDAEAAEAADAIEALQQRVLATFDVRAFAREAATIRNDAARYRWLRDVGDSTWQPMIRRGITAAECDADIDAAIAKALGE